VPPTKTPALIRSHERLLPGGGRATLASGVPGPDELRRLPENVRRPVMAALASLLRSMPELTQGGTIAATHADVARLEELRGALGATPEPPNLEAVRQALLAVVDDLEPERLAGYGALQPGDRETLMRLVSALRVLLEHPHPPGGTGGASC
jgi:hypothetical protein